MGPTDEVQDQDPWVNRLKLNVSHKKGSFTFCTFPDTGSAAIFIAADFAQKKNIQAAKPSHTKYINVSGDPLPTIGTTPIQLNTPNHVAHTNAVITPAISNEIIISRDDLKKGRGTRSINHGRINSCRSDTLGGLFRRPLAK